MSDKSYVGMSTCFVCGEVKEILIDRRVRDILPSKACYDKAPCTKCLEHMENGVILISVSEEKTEDRSNPYRTGGWIVITDDAVEKIFDTKFANSIKEHRVAFIGDEAWDIIGFPRGEVKDEN